MSYIPNNDVDLAKSGDAKALETIIRNIQDRVHHLALRMLADPTAAQDATQEILIRVVTKLSTYRSESRFETWVHRIAINYLLTARKVIANDPGLSFQMFSEDLLDGLVDDQTQAAEDHVMLNELRIKCTMAMLLCLDRDHRAAYVLGEIMEFDHGEAAEVLEISPANFRKRLSRARSKIQDFTAATCGLTNRSAPCSCRRRLPAALVSGRVGPTASPELAEAPSFADVEKIASQVEADLVTAKLQRATGPMTTHRDFAAEILKLIDTPI